MNATQIEARYGPVVARVESSSSDSVYEIRRNPSGTYSCQCTAWKFRKTCKHVLAVIADDAGGHVPSTTVQTPQPFQPYKAPKIPKAPKVGPPVQEDPIHRDAEFIASMYATSVAVKAQLLEAVEKAIRKYAGAMPAPEPVKQASGFGVRVIVLDD